LREGVVREASGITADSYALGKLKFQLTFITPLEFFTLVFSADQDEMGVTVS